MKKKKKITYGAISVIIAMVAAYLVGFGRGVDNSTYTAIGGILAVIVGGIKYFTGGEYIN